jgi:cellobiose phosphorylase
MIAGKEAYRPGEAKNSWLTGTASWNYVAITQHILGIKPTFDGLQIAPVFPQSWKEFHVQREFRGCVYSISVERIGPGNYVSIEVEGKPIPGNIVPIPPSEIKSIRIKAIIG